MSFKNLVVQGRKRFGEEGAVKFLQRLGRFSFYQLLKKKRSWSYEILKLRSKERFLLKDVQGSQMHLDLKDEGICLDLYFDGIREPNSTVTIKELLKEGDVVVDIGANIGYYALLEAKLVGEKGKIYAIEPVPQNVEILRKNVKVNNYGNVEIFQLAIGDANKKAEIYLSPKSNWHSLHKYRDFKTVSSVEVDVMTLDSFLENKREPQLVRMDVEGYEYEILEGMEKLLADGKPLKLFIELHPQIMGKEKTSALLKKLQKFKFNIRAISKSRAYPRIKYFGKEIAECSAKKIDDLLADEKILSGEESALEIFFER